MLTARQRDAYRAIVEHFEDRGYPPTHAYVAAQLGVSQTWASELINGLVDAGFIRKDKYESRGLAIVRRVDPQQIKVREHRGGRRYVANALPAT